MTTRCQWAGSDPLYLAYHDLEWGVPVHDDRALFEFLVLEGAQAGLSWSTILKKRAAYRAAFDNFDPAVVAAYDEARVAELLANPGIVRNRAKVAAAIRNAQAFLAVQQSLAALTPTSGALWAAGRGRTPGVACPSCPPRPTSRAP
jgi:DNA-3-methyladenine glycosylase I